MDLGKLNLPMVVGLRLGQIYSIAPAASKNDAEFKSGKDQLKNNHLSSIINLNP